MIILTILAIALLALVVGTIITLLVGSFSVIALFGDVIIAALVIWFGIKLFRKLKK